MYKIISVDFKSDALIYHYLMQNISIAYKMRLISKEECFSEMDKIGKSREAKIFQRFQPTPT